MIFVTLGSQKFKFERILQAIDDQIDEGLITDEVFAQIGHNTYSPWNYDAVNFLDTDTFQKKINEADIVICHAGTGSIIKSLKAGKNVIVVPRRPEFNEHVNAHQEQIADMFSVNGLVIKCDDVNELWKCIKEAKEKEPKTYTSNTEYVLNKIDLAVRKLCAS